MKLTKADFNTAEFRSTCYHIDCSRQAIYTTYKHIERPCALCQTHYNELPDRSEETCPGFPEVQHYESEDKPPNIRAAERGWLVDKTKLEFLGTGFCVRGKDASNEEPFAEIETEKCVFKYRTNKERNDVWAAIMRYVTGSV